MIRIFSRQIEKLHSRDGQALVFVAMVGLVIFLFFALTMNLAELVQLKIKNQNTADAAALSAAVWQARVLNTVSALNQNILDGWVYLALGESSAFILTLVGCGYLCCGWQCPLNPACQGCLLAAAIQLFGILASVGLIEATGRVQDEVLVNFDAAFVREDVSAIVDLNYDFKPNARTADIDTDLYLYLNENDGNIFLPGAGGPGTDFVLERGFICELVVGLLYNYCRRGLIPGGGCSTGFWTNGMRVLYQQMAAGPSGGVDSWYGAGGACEGSNLENSPLAGLEVPSYLVPYVLRTFVNNPGGPYTPVNPEEVMPITGGVYREEWPPVLHMWGAGFRRDLDCGAVPDDVFPCADQGHFNFASAHAYSPSVADFYWHFYTAGPWTMGYTTAYPVPLVPAISDWEARLFPVEPGLESGELSPYGGTAAYNDIAAQVAATVGAEAENFLMENVLTDPLPPHADFFLY